MLKKIIALYMTVFLFLAGCSHTPVSPQGPWYPLGGDLNWVADSDMETTYTAVIDALAEMKLTVSDPKHDALGAKIQAMTSRDEKLIIMLTPESQEWTRVVIQVKNSSDKGMKAEVVYQNIQKHLKTVRMLPGQ